MVFSFVCLAKLLIFQKLQGKEDKPSNFTELSPPTDVGSEWSPSMAGQCSSRTICGYFSSIGPSHFNKKWNTQHSYKLAEKLQKLIRNRLQELIPLVDHQYAWSMMSSNQQYLKINKVKVTLLTSVWIYQRDGLRRDQKWLLCNYNYPLSLTLTVNIIWLLFTFRDHYQTTKMEQRYGRTACLNITRGAWTYAKQTCKI